MAELRKIGVRLTAEGVNQYKEDLRSAGREARLMSQETRLAMAELGNNASSTDKFTTKLKSLEREYGVQENKLKTLSNAQKEYTTSLNMVEREIKGTSDEMRKSQRETDRLEKEYRELGKSAGWNAEETRKAKQAWEASKVETRELGRSLNDLEKDQAKYTRELDKMPGKMNSAKIEMAELSNEMAKVREEYIKSGGQLAGVADRIGEASGKVRKFSDGMISVGDTMTTAVTLPIVAGVAAVVKVASDWESAWAGVVKTNDDVLDANGNVVYSLEQLEEELRGLAKELPATHAEIAAVAEAAGQLGIQTDNVTSFTKTMIDMGESTNLAAEVAAESLARFANITGMSQDDFDRLGSSIVALGNNFATTEADIVAMAMRLAGAGSQVGLSEADIMGLSAALSSVGIEAELGGTAISKTMVNMAVATETGLNAVRDLEKATGMSRRELELLANHDGAEFKSIAENMGMTTSELNKILKAGKDLEGFAAVAGMTGEQFKKAFEEDAVGALGAFIEGLGSAEEKGTTAIQLLDELGISEVRLRDSLLRAGNASELFAEAIDMSSTAFEDNTALSEEANIRYETLASQLGMLRNEIFDVAIELGGPFVKALREGFKAATPFLGTLSDLASAFSEMDEDSQRSIINLIGIAAAAGPVTKGLGTVGKYATTTGRGIEWLTRRIGGMHASATTAMPAVETTGSAISSMGGAAATAGGAKGVGLFTSALGALGPVGWGIVGAGGLLAVGYGAWKLWGEGVYEASERTKRWGTDVSEETDKVLTDFTTMNEEASNATWKMAMNVEEGASQAMESYSSMAAEITKSAQENIATQEQELAGLPDTVRGIMQSLYEDRLAEQSRIIGEVESINTSINSIYSQAMEENRELTNQELEMVENHHKRLNELRADTLDMSVEDQRQVQSVLLEDLKTFSEEELRTRQGYISDQMIEMDKMYDGQIQALREAVIAGEITQREADAKEKALLEQRKQTNLEFAKEYVKVWNEMGHPVEAQNEMLERYGLTHAEVMQEVAFESAEAGGAISFLAETTGELTEESREANNAWNDFQLENKFGDVDTNVHEVIQEASESEEGWQMLEFVLKHATLNTNSRETIREALEENGKWNELSFVDKEANLFTNAQATAMEYLKANGDWEQLTFQEQIAFLDTNSPEQLKQILTDYGIWQRLDPAIKDLIMESNVPKKVRESEASINHMNGVRPLPVNITASTNVPTVVSQAQRAINSLRGKTVRVETVHSVTGAPHASRPYATRATGDPYFEGGKVWLGDGGRREPYLSPSGHFGVSSNDWELHQLEKGTRIWPSMQAFKTQARYQTGLKQYLNQLPKFAKGGTIENPYDGYAGLVGEAGPEIFQIAQGKVSITPISQNQRTQVLDSQRGTDMTETNSLLQTLIQLVAQGQTIQMDKVAVGRTVYDEVDTIMTNNFSRREIMSIKGGG